MIAQRSNWKSMPLPERHEAIGLDRSYTSEELARIKEGVIPQEMEDKWFIFYEEPWLYIHRSWTGFCIYQVRFKQSDTLFKVVEVLVNRDPVQYTEMDTWRDQLMAGIVLDGRARRDVRESMKQYIAVLQKKKK